ncbi:hypothetical protein DDD63_03310 [Actinobaculum sp. 313]|nr:hypothetical protein DDD63_03310 [Actinobaculum sp. 313]
MMIATELCAQPVHAIVKPVIGTMKAPTQAAKTESFNRRKKRNANAIPKAISKSFAHAGATVIGSTSHAHRPGAASPRFGPLSKGCPPATMLDHCGISPASRPVWISAIAGIEESMRSVT